MNEKSYHIDKRGKTVVLRTTSFRTERRSVLHSGVFNRELAASLASGAVILVMSFFFALYFRITALYLAAVVLLFAVFFILFRLCLFKEAILETVFDGERGTVTISMKGVAGAVRRYPLHELSGVSIGHKSLEPENIDAVKLVERIALQHGTVMPGFGKTEEYYTVKLDLRDDEIVIFSAGERRGAENLMNELKKALNGFLPHTVRMSE
jgi:hypothetical protein